MNKPQKKGVIVSAASPQMSPAYQSAIAQAGNHYETMSIFVEKQMKRGVDYGIIPGGKKPTLLKGGAEKLCKLFGLRASYELIDFITDFEKPLFYYQYRCTLMRQGEVVGQGDGSSNSKEKKYEAQQYKIFDLTNTICKMSQKRAFVAAVLSSCGASTMFTQDMEDMGGAE